jgi:hypothetical protein
VQSAGALQRRTAERRCDLRGGVRDGPQPRSRLAGGDAATTLSHQLIVRLSQVSAELKRRIWVLAAVASSYPPPIQRTVDSAGATSGRPFTLLHPVWVVPVQVNPVAPSAARISALDPFLVKTVGVVGVADYASPSVLALPGRPHRNLRLRFPSDPTKVVPITDYISLQNGRCRDKRG